MALNMKQKVKQILWKASRKLDCNTWIIITAYLLSMQKDVDAVQHKGMQRRFMWKHVDETVDDIMGSMKNIFDFSPSTHATVHSPYEYLPSETTRVKYIFRSTSGKPTKIIKMQTPKKTIKTIKMPRPMADGKLYKPMMKFPSANELRKLEKEQEKIIESKVPLKTAEEVFAKIESEQHMDNFKDYQTEYRHEYSPEYKMPEEVYEDVVTGHIKEFGNEWAPMHTQLTENNNESIPFAPSFTASPYALSHLHTSIISSEPFSEQIDHNDHKQYEHDSEYHFENATEKQNTYEVTEYNAEESVALPLTSAFRSRTAFGNAEPGIDVRDQPTNSISLATTTEAPNYPAAFLRKISERTAADSPRQGGPSEGVLLDTSWMPMTRSISNKTVKIKTNRKPEYTRNSAELLPMEILRTESIGNVAAQNTEQRNTSKNVQTVRRKTFMPTSTESTPPNKGQRGRVRFGDKLSIDNY